MSLCLMRSRTGSSATWRRSSTRANISSVRAGALLLARQVMRRLDVMSGEALEAWYNYYSTGEAAYFYPLTGAVSDR